MKAKAQAIDERKVLDGNGAAAYGVMLCKPTVVAAYPITPMTPLIERLARFVADGQLKAETVEVEGEHSALSVLIGASNAGGRTFTATSSQGLAFMAEAYIKAAMDRIPIVMVIVGRELAGPDGVFSGQQDSLTLRDAGWVQIYTESCQEILDAIIMAYRLAEDEEILLPVNVCYDGYYLSHLIDGVEVPAQKDVDRFLAPLSKMSRFKLDPEVGLTYGGLAPPEIFTEYRYAHLAALDRAKNKIDAIDLEFKQFFGRGYGGQIEEYRMEDAEIALISMGSPSGTAKAVIDNKRDAGVKVGLVRVRALRPFPKERLAKALQGQKAVGVLDKNVCFGWDCGVVLMETKAALHEAGVMVPAVGFIGGLGNCDITKQHISRAIEAIDKAAQGQPHKPVTWLNLE
jgi:pyruvate ferredoxin oxidoreductase alpha subunit/phenylglyoxylate dehydrogenase alpha subunit